MDVILGVICAIFFLIGEFYLILAAVKKWGGSRCIQKVCGGTLAFIVINSLYFYHATSNPPQIYYLEIAGIAWSILIACFGIYSVFRDYYSAFMRRRTDKA